MTPEEVKELLLRFLDHEGMFNSFKSWIESEGYTLDELGISE